MEKYNYKAVNRAGQEITGSREANDEYELAKILRQDGLVMIFAETGSSPVKKGWQSAEIEIPFLSGISFVEKLMLVRNLQIMVAAGIALPQALDILASQIENPKLKRIISSVHDEIIKGKTLSESAKKYPEVFSDFFCGMVAIGEKTGGLDKVLKDLAYQMEKEYKLKEKVKGAMAYPSVILAVMFLLGIGMMVFVVPRLLSVFETMGMPYEELPQTTKILMNIGDFFKSNVNIAIFFSVILAIVFGIRSYAKTKGGKKLFDKVFIKAPILGDLVRKSNIASVIGNFSILLSSGIPVVEALSILSSSIGNYYFKQSLEDASEKIQKGQKFSEALSPYKHLYSMSVVQMINIGEETGMTSEILMKLSQFYEEEVSRAADSLTTIIEPILMILVAVAVGFFASALFSPIYSSLGSL